MGVLRRKTWINIAATLLVALAFFSIAYGIAEAQAKPDDANGPATVAENLGITGYRSVVFEALMSIGTMIAWLGGSLFDISIAVFTAGMAQTAEALGLKVMVSELWALVRDLFNLLFIFGLIYASFKIILDANDSASKKTIGTILVAALLINFSLYVAQVVVDFTNVAAYQIHQLIAADDNSGMTLFGVRVPDTTDQFVLFSGINETAKEDQTKILKNEVAKLNNESSVNNIGSAIVLGLMFCIFYTILGFVFAACAIILFTRFFALIFLMIFSPMMFLGWVIPSMKSQSSKWWKYFSNQALVGPALLFMIYLSLRALQGIGTTGREGGIIATAIYLMIVAAFLLASLKVAKSFGAYGTDMAMNIGNSARGFAGRQTLGRLGDRYNRSLEEKGVSDKSWRRKVASSMAGAKYGGSYSRVDERGSNEKAAQKRARYDQIQGSPIRIPGTNMAVPFTRGASKERRGIIQNVATGGIDMEKAISGASNEQILELLGQNPPGTDMYKKLVENMSASQFEAAMKAKPEEMDDGAKAKLSAARKSAVEQYLNKQGGSLAQNIKNASDAQLKVIGAEDIEKHAADLKQSQFDDIMKSKDFTETEKSQIKKAREDELFNRFDTGTVNIFAGLQDKDIASLPKKILLDSQGRQLPYLSGGALRKIAEDDKLTESERHSLVNIITTPGTPSLSSTAQKYLNSPQGQEKYG